MVSSVDPCRICGSVDAFERFTLREMLFGTRERFDYRRCGGCGVMAIETVPADLARHYPPEYYAIAGPEPRPTPRSSLAGALDAARDGATLFGAGRLRTTLLRRSVGPPSAEMKRSVAFVRRAGLRSFHDAILDVGCGRIPGSLHNLRRLGFRNLRGIDPFLEGSGVVDGIVLERRSIHDVDGRFRLITMHHSFEHMPDPAEVMVSAARLLEPGGTLLVRTPIMGTWFWQTYGVDWWELDPPRHLFVHTVTSLDRCATAAGLVRVGLAWDSTVTEIIASEQIARDIAWREPASYGTHPPAGLTDEVLAGWTAKVRELNETGRAGRAGAYYRASARATGAPG